ncbi:hypothetical protein TESG_04283 [Trichophyton tonsurans CBS 112818]|uniref:G-patch domain-containing protein n=1 Tax=Trichophyton tonsurans (strain CBS 112818) TaxID=647933 RepID=F2RZQ7_TRIT1|nr:hypothetical protein TESG_04283 [Trichophyton tonsurans CBS 112818]
MDPQAYLMNQGWSGPGNPLNPSRRPGAHGGLGLTKPILVARKKNTHGIGKKTTHDHTNQWWLRGFEAALRGIGTDGNATSGSGESTPETPKSELYKFFVRGPGLAGTIKPNEYSKPLQSLSPDFDTPSGPNSGTSNKKKKRKRENTEASLTVDASQGKKERKKKSRDTKGRLAICGIANPPEEEDHKEITPYMETMESMKEEISGRRKRKKEEKKEKKRRQAEALASELRTKSRTSDQSSDEDSRKEERERAAKKARIEEKQGKKKEKEESKKKAEKKVKRISKD